MSSLHERVVNLASHSYRVATGSKYEAYVGGYTTDTYLVLVNKHLNLIDTILLRELNMLRKQKENLCATIRYITTFSL